MEEWLMDLKTIHDGPLHLGALALRLPEPWKISAVAEINGEPVAMSYNNVTRSNSEIRTKAGPIYFCDAETIGVPLVWGDYVFAAGECGDLLCALNGQIQKAFPLDWATTCCVYGGRPLVIDQKKDKKNYVRDCITGDTVCMMPGNYIALDSCVWRGLLWAAIGWDQGLSCSDGKLYRAKMCQSVVNHRDQLLFSSGNRVMTLENGGVKTLGELPCEKIMQLESFDNDFLYIVGAKPDTLWMLDSRGQLSTVGVVTDGQVDEVGGVCFGWCASRNYFVRTRKGSQVISGRRTDCAEVYPIIGG
jgi:hypothetical protein